LGARTFPGHPRWTSGHDLAKDADLLIHDAQFTDGEYENRVGWGHSAITDTARFARLVGARRLVTFHHDPSHSDDTLDRMAQQVEPASTSFDLIPGQEGRSFTIGA
jgi:ribonuclease BN (tRNA processing enzyme)